MGYNLASVRDICKMFALWFPGLSRRKLQTKFYPNRFSLPW